MRVSVFNDRTDWWWPGSVTLVGTRSHHHILWELNLIVLLNIWFLRILIRIIALIDILPSFTPKDHLHHLLNIGNIQSSTSTTSPWETIFQVYTLSQNWIIHQELFICISRPIPCPRVWSLVVRSCSVLLTITYLSPPAITVHSWKAFSVLLAL